MTSLRRLIHISKKYLVRDFSEASQKYLLQVSVIFLKYPAKMISYDFRRLIRISDKIGVEPLEHSRNEMFSGSSVSISIKSAMSINGLIPAWEFWQVNNDRQNTAKSIRRKRRKHRKVT